MNISPARVAAFEVLSRIEAEKAFSSVLLPQYEVRLSELDRGLCHTLTLGVLRRQIYLDKVIEHFAGNKKLDRAVRISLRLGLFQLLYMDRVPAHSAVDESVSLVQRAKKSSARGFVNAILRRSQREPFEPVYADEIDRLSIETSHPRWLVERWVRNFGGPAANDLAEANNRQPAVAFRLTSASSSAVDLHGIRPSENVSGCFIADARDRPVALAAERGEIYFQDEGSQLVGSAVRIPEGGRFLDVCASPGSKTTQIASRGGWGICVAGDLHPARVRFLLQNIRSQRVARTEVVQYDAERALPFAPGCFDTVLVDSPCSGTGTIRHNPEIRYFLVPEDLAALPDKQRLILRNASKMVRSGGTLVYSTCSLESEENEAVANDLVKMEPSFKKIEPAVSPRFLTADGYARTMPHIDDMDGFFIAAFAREVKE